jgi:hypothetical protein
VRSLIDIDKTVDDDVESSIKLIKADILTETQSADSGFAAFDGVLALNTIDSMADGLKVQISSQIEDWQAIVGLKAA